MGTYIVKVHGKNVRVQAASYSQALAAQQAIKECTNAKRRKHRG